MKIRKKKEEIMNKKFLMYGAGNIGRGFIGQVFSESGYEVTFLDINEKVIDALNRDGQYPVNIVSDAGNREITVKNVKGVLAKDNNVVAEEIFNADIMATALGVNVLKYVIKPLSLGIKRRIDAKKPLNIIICENLIDANHYIKDLVLKELPVSYAKDFDKYIGLVEASIGRMVPVMDESMQAGNPLRIYVEEYCVLPVDKDAFVGKIPPVKNLLPFSPFALYIQRKLYMHNMSHALTAYFGFLTGCKYISDAAANGDILYLAHSALIQSARALAKEHNTGLTPLLDHAGNLISRFQNGALKDTTARVGRDTVRKLGVSDRLTGALSLCRKHGVRNTFICAAVAAALLFNPGDDPASSEVCAYVNASDIQSALKKYCGLEPCFETELIEKVYNMLKSKMPLPAIIKLLLSCEKE